MKTYKVTVLVEGNRPETHIVNEPREGLAKTHAMALYQQKLAGQEVRYEITEVTGRAASGNG